MKYIPILKYKERIDLSAYDKLEININDDITPLIELFQEEKIQMSRISENKSFFCSILTERNLEFDTAVEMYIEAKNYHKNLIPVINSDYKYTSISKKDLVKSAKKLYANFDSVALKINGVKSFYLPDELETILLLRDNLQDMTVFLDIDFAFKHEYASMIKIFSKAMDAVHNKLDDAISNFVLCGSIVSVSSSGLKTFDGDQEFNIRKNELLKVFHALSGTYSEYNLKYGDYTIDEKNMFTDDVGGGTFFPSVKYTDENGDICIYKSEERNEFDKYKKIANLISEREDYDKEHCLGCGYIDSIITENAGGKNTGSPSTWKYNMMAHHMRRMIQILG